MRIDEKQLSSFSGVDCLQHWLYYTFATISAHRGFGSELPPRITPDFDDRKKVLAYSHDFSEYGLCLVNKDRDMNPPILVALDRRERSLHALAAATKQAKPANSDLLLIYGIDCSPYGFHTLQAL